MNDTFKYKGYTGSIEISIEDKCLHGKILFVTDVISYEAKEVETLEPAFREAVDDYIETCKELGKEPNKPFSGSFNVRIGPELHRKAAIEAHIKGTTLNEIVKSSIEYFVPNKGVSFHESSFKDQWTQIAASPVQIGLINVESNVFSINDGTPITSASSVTRFRDRYEIDEA